MQENTPRAGSVEWTVDRMSRGLAVCFCGGRSERMGEDKAWLTWDSSFQATSPAPQASQSEPGQADSAAAQFKGTLLAHGTGRLEALGCKEVVLASGAGAPRYAAAGKRELCDSGVSLSNSRPEERSLGPLAGLVAALEEAEALGLEWIFVLACDLPHARVETMRSLVDYALGADADVCLAQAKDEANPGDSSDSFRTHPLFGFYSLRCLGPAKRALEAGRRRMISFHDPEFSRAPAVAGQDSSRFEESEARALTIEAFEVASDETTNLNTPNDYERERSEASRASGERENGTA